MKTRILINGKVNDQINVLDRGLLYGDGVFETIAIRGRRIALWHEHIQRLQLACEILQISCPDETLLKEEITQLIDQFDHNISANFIVRVTLTRGVSRRGYRPVPNTTPSRIISICDLPDSPKKYSTTGIRLRCCHTRLAKSSLAGIKHLNRLEQVLAQSEWQPDDGIQEGLMLDYDNHVIEGTMSNVFIVKNQQLMTPDLHYAGVAGVMRQSVMSLAKNHNIEIQESHLSLDEVKNADEVFMSNSLIGIWPVKQLEPQGKLDTISWLAPGELTKKIMQLIDHAHKISGIIV